MSRQPFIVAIVGLAILNGMFSPFLRGVFAAVTVLAPTFFTSSVAVVLFISSLAVSTLTIMIAGIPAALYERATGAPDSTPASMYIWLAGTAILTLPAVLTFLEAGGF